MAVVLNYVPHEAQRAIHAARGKRFRTVCTGRRFGKTLCLAAELLDRGGAHSESFMQIARGDAVTLSGLMQREIDVPLLNTFFPGRPALAYFEFSPVASDQTRQVVQDAAALAKAGLKMDAGEVAEKTGYRVDTDRRLKTAD